MYPDRESWLAARREVPHSIGASEVARIIGGAWGGEWAAWADLTGRRKRQEKPVFATGHQFEPLVGHWACSRLPGFELAGDEPALLRLPGAEWAACSPDGWGGPADKPVAMLEIKTDGGAGATERWPEDGAIVQGDRIGLLPHGYGWQVGWQCAVAGCVSGHIAVACGRAFQMPELRLIELRFTDDQLDDLFGRVERWREVHLIGDLEPAITPDVAEEAVKVARRDGRDGEIDGTPELAELVAAWRSARPAADVAAFRADQAEHELLRATTASRVVFRDGVLGFDRFGKPVWRDR